MTEEQIEQKAEEYAKKHYDIPFEDDSSMNFIVSEESYIAGAHSRDEEIEHYRRVAEAYKIDAQDTAAECERLHDIIDKLRNPWISVEDRLPEIGDTVVINVHHTIDGGGEHHEDDQILVENYNGRWICDRCKQHRIVNHLFDTISKTTHWIPIPQIQKGGEK